MDGAAPAGVDTPTRPVGGYEVKTWGRTDRQIGRKQFGGSGGREWSAGGDLEEFGLASRIGKRRGSAALQNLAEV